MLLLAGHQSYQGLGKSPPDVEALGRDVAEVVPVDPKRPYGLGYDGGGRIAVPGQDGHDPHDRVRTGLPFSLHSLHLGKLAIHRPAREGLFRRAPPSRFT